MKRDDLTPSQRDAGLSRGLDRVLRAALFLVPFGVLGNLALSWFATDHTVLRSLGRLDLRYLWLAIFLALFPWGTNTLRLSFSRTDEAQIAEGIARLGRVFAEG